MDIREHSDIRCSIIVPAKVSTFIGLLHTLLMIVILYKPPDQHMTIVDWHSYDYNKTYLFYITEAIHKLYNGT